MGKQCKDSAYVHVSDLSLTVIKLSYVKSVTPWWNSEYEDNNKQASNQAIMWHILPSKVIKVIYSYI